MATPITSLRSYAVEIEIDGQIVVVDPGEDVEVPDELAGRPPSGVPGIDEDYDLGVGFLAQVDNWAPTHGAKPARPTVKAVLKAVGDDHEKAAAALEAENASDEPRSTLVEQLQAIIDGGEG